MILRCQGLYVSFVVLLAACAAAAPARAQRKAPGSELPAPILVYTAVPFSAAPSAAPPLSEDRALSDPAQLARLRKSGLRIHFDLIDASAIAPDGLRPATRTAAWLDSWIARCRAAQIQPGLRFTLSGEPPPDLVAALQSWYDRGIRLFAFDDLDLVSASSAAGTAIDKAAARNASALNAALAAFRAKNRGAVLLAIESNAASREESSSLGAFVLLSTGPPHASRLPQASLQRAIDVETGAQARRIEQSGAPLAHILSPGFTFVPAATGDSGAPYPSRPWKSAFLLSMARGGWVNTLSGNLDSISAADARWMARVEKLFFALQARGRMRSFGASPSSSQPYGFIGATSQGAVCVVVNPRQAVATLSLPAFAPDQTSSPARILFRDAGFSLRLTGNNLTLGPGQMAVVGFGVYAGPQFNLGVDPDVVIPSSIEPVDADFHLTAPGLLEARFDPPIQGVLRIVVRERLSGPDSVDAVPPASTASTHRFSLDVTQAGRPIPLRATGSGADSVLVAGPSWAVAEIDVNDLTPGILLRVRVRSNEENPPILEGSAYQIIY